MRTIFSVLLRAVLVPALVLVGVSGAARAAESYALQMPLASRSLLLDIERGGQRLVAVGERGHILLSDDLGESWRQARVPTRQMLTAASFPSARRGWAVGHDGVILATVDGGENWVIQRDGLAAQARINRARLARLRERRAALLAPGAEAVDPWQLEELAMDIEDAELLLDEPVHAPPLLDVYFSDELNGVATGAFNTLLRTMDGGVTWQHMPEALDNPDEYHLNSLTGDGKGTLWIAGEGGLLFRSGDGGASWQTLPSPSAGTWFGIARSPGSGRLLAFGLRGKVFASEDGGDSWTRLAVPTDRSLAGGCFAGDQYALLVGAVGTLLTSRDGGHSFTLHTLDSRVNLSAGICAGADLLLVGQSGVHRAPGFGANHES